MAGLDREAIYAALFTRLQTIAGIQKFYRVDLPPDQIPDSLQPALILKADTEEPQQRPGTGPVWTLRPTVGILARTKSTDESPDTVLAGFVKLAEEALQRPQTEPQRDASHEHETTLGGVCRRAWLSGPVQYIQGRGTQEGTVYFWIEIIAETP